jgi:ligand-binding sensor domain-containing protein
MNKNPSAEGFFDNHILRKLLIITCIMSKNLISWMLFLVVFMTSCGTAYPASEADHTPSASPSDLIPASPPTSLVQPNTSYSNNIRFELFSLEEGLSQSVVNTILQDRRGFLWIGTEDGLNRYDGYNFKVYKPDTNNPFSLNDRSITSMVEDQQGYLWIGTRNGGLNRYNPVSGKFTNFTHDQTNHQSIASNQVHALCLDENGMWIGTDNGLDYLDFETNVFTHYRVSSDDKGVFKLSSNYITTIMKDSKGALWIGTINAGLNVYDKARNVFTAYKYKENDSASLSHNRVLSIAEGRNGDVWVGTARGLNRYNPIANYFTRYLNSPNNSHTLAGNVIHAVHMDRSGGLWVGTDNGLDRYDPQAKKFIHHKHQPSVANTLSKNEVYAIYEDTNGILWIGTYGGGLNKYNRQQDRFSYYRNNPDDPNSLSANFVLPILADEDGYVWIGTHGGGLNRMDPQSDEFVRFEHDPNDPSTINSNNVISLYMDQTGTLWVGTVRGLEQFHPALNTFDHYLPESVDVNDGIAVFAIYEDTDKNFWIGTNRGLYRFDKNSKLFEPYEHEKDESNSFSWNQITIIQEDNVRNLWIGTFDDGLKRINLDTNETIHYRHNPEDAFTLGNNTILSMHQDQNGTLWIGTYGGGLSRYDPASESFARFTENEGLPNNVIYGILEDSSGNLWLSTNFGLSRFDPVNQIFRNFTASDGLQSNEFNQNAFAKDQSGNMYFGGINGFNFFLPEMIQDNPSPPNVALTSITQDGAPLIEEQTAEYLRNITLKWPQDSFDFEFTALTYEQPSKNQYSYTLEGFDTDWINIGSQRNGRYTNLPGGTYTLHLRGSNSDGIWNEQGQAIQIVILPPFWETWWFIGLLVIVLGVSAAGILRWRVKSVENRNRELERLVKNRTADLEKRTDEMEALYQADEKILRSVTLNQIFQALVGVSISMLKADRSMIFVWNEERKKIMPHFSRGFQPETLEVLNFEYDEGEIGLAMKTGTAVVVSNIKLSTCAVILKPPSRAKAYNHSRISQLSWMEKLWQYSTWHTPAPMHLMKIPYACSRHW